ncbi:MAG: MFS transporter [Deltaproteobacteria bacterium]|nr:MFS transporter [Deltaproteobacteria bacterium]
MPKTAFKFIFLLGIVSLFGDITYEGARSITGPFLSTLGASGAVVGLIAGFGEFIGYGLRLVSGYISDKTKGYWAMVFIGYGLILSIPLLSLVNCWEIAAILIVLERVGKAIRSPARDTILSHATMQVGRGFGFGIHEALDQVGAIIGPLIFSLVFYLKWGYREGLSILLLPAILTLLVLTVARRRYPLPQGFERPIKADKGRLSPVFWLYTIFTLLSVTGYANFQLISYHFKIKSVISNTQIPIFYAIAMAIDAIVALIIGKIYDKIGLMSLISIPLFTALIPIFSFSCNYSLALTGIIIWGTVMGMQETIMRAAIADLTPTSRRGLAYGIFNTIYGASWFIGGTLMGILYDFSIRYVIIFATIMELASVPVLIRAVRSQSI